MALLSISDVASDLIPAMTGLASVTMDLAIPAIRALAGAAQWVVSRLGVGLNAAGVAARGPAAGIAGMFGPMGGGRRGAGRDETDLAVSDVLAELRSGLMKTPVGTGGAASAFTRAQTAALSMSPFERRMQDMMGKVVTMMEKANRQTPPSGANTERQPAKPVGR